MATFFAPSSAVDGADAVDRLDLLLAGLDLIDQGFTLFDSELRLVAWNRALFDILEFPLELACMGTPFAAFMRYNAERGDYGQGDTETLVADRVRAAKAFEPHRFERVRPNGQVIEVRGEPVPGRGFVTIYADITAQRTYERLIRDQNIELERRVTERTLALARNEERLRLVSDGVPALIAYLDRERIFRFVNEGFARWFGHSKDSIVGRSMAEALGSGLHAELAPQVERALMGETVSYEYATPGAGGATLYVSSTLVPERGTAGEVSGVYVLGNDITAQKRAQTALLQAQKMEAIGLLTGGLAHDFNNMLTVVIGNLLALQERDTSKATADFLEPALMGARRGVELIRRLLTLARQQPLTPQPVNVAALIGDLVHLLRRSLPENISLVTRLDSDGLFALADANQLENALLNLALNARDAMPEGGVLTVATDMHTVDKVNALDLELDPGDYVRVSVADSGRGMDAATLARVFEPFFTTKSFASGSGLGLSMVYGFVKQSGGALRLASDPGHGTTATLLLARSEVAPGPVEKDLDPVTTQADQRLVLLVEDDPDVCRIVRLQLNDLGHPVIEARDGVEAMRLLETVPDIAILISDVVMPGGVDGRSLAMHARRRRPGIDILLMSAYEQSPAVDSSYFALLPKPFSKRELVAAMEACKQ